MSFHNHRSAFPKRNVDRFTISCPACGTGKNSEDFGGNDRCFHCDTCGLVECEITSPAVKNESINGYGQSQ
jgi:transcription elongation factor Elf1